MSIIALFCTETQAQSLSPSASLINIEELLRTIEAQNRAQQVLLKTLINEIKQNLIIYQANSINLYRLQRLTNDRNDQQFRVDSINTEIDLLDQQLSQSNQPSILESEIKLIEEQITQTSDITQRVMLTQAYNTAKRSFENETSRLTYEKEANRLRHQNLTIKLQSEKIRLAEIDESLSEMEKYFQQFINGLPTKTKQ